MNDRQMTERAGAQGLGALPELDVFTAPADERLVEPADGLESSPGDGHAPTADVLDHRFDLHIISQPLLGDDALRALLGEIKDEPLQVDRLPPLGNAPDDLGRVVRGDEK